MQNKNVEHDTYADCILSFAGMPTRSVPSDILLMAHIYLHSLGDNDVKLL